MAASRATNSTLPEYTRYSISPDDRVKYRARQFRLSKIDGEFVILRSQEEDLVDRTEAFSLEEIDRLIRLKVLEVDVGYFKDANLIARKRGAGIFELSPDIILRARMLSEFLEAELDVYETGEKVSRSDRSITKFIAKFDAENQGMVPKPRGGGKSQYYRDTNIVGPRQFRRLLKQFEEGGLHPTSLLPRYKGRQTLASTFTTKEQEYAQRFALLYQTTDRHNMKTCYELMVGDNDARPSKGLELVRLPSMRTFQRIINDLGDFNNEWNRAGDPKRVERKYELGKKGLQPKFPLEIVEMDEHKVDLVRILVRNGIWQELHPDVKAKIEERSRPWLSVAMDAYSRSILGMRLLYDEPDALSSLETLAMAVRVKDGESALSGAVTGWPQCGTPRAVHTDAGAAYISTEFQAAVLALTDRHVIPPSKHPHLRGRVERFFRTLNQRYISLFAGRTFSNVLLRDQYDSVKHAHITHEELGTLMVRLIVDCYHNTVQRGLDGHTPLQAWYRGSQLEGEVQPPPSDEEYRDIFGVADTRKIGGSGIEILANRYTSPKLQALRKEDLDLNVEVRINPQDLAEISVKHPDHGWFSVPATYEGLKNVPIEDWVETVRYIKKHFGKRRKYDVKVVNDTMRQVSEASQQSKDRYNIGSCRHTSATIRALESKETANFSYSAHREIDLGYDDERLDRENEKGLSDAASLLPEDRQYERPKSFVSLDVSPSEQQKSYRPAADNRQKVDETMYHESIDDEDDNGPIVRTPIEVEKRKRRDV